VEAAAVLLKTNTDGDQQLIAFVQSGPHNTEDIRSHAAQFLPAYMLPNTIIPLQQMPLTVNGKTDRDALLAIADSATDTRRPYEAPRNETEQRLAAIWEEILGRSPIGIKDDFFELGGHSLLAMHAVLKTRKELGIDLPIKTFFELGTIQRISEFIKQSDL
jgi:acyl carrier protein